MTGSGTEGNAMRLLAAFRDMAGGKLNVGVPVGGPDVEEDGASEKADPEWDAVERDIALKYLLDQDYVRAAEDGSGYSLTYHGLERAREYQGLAGD
ncbi:MAG: hypothetical protein WA990_15235 [Rubrobacteraceae bacterium]